MLAVTPRLALRFRGGPVPAQVPVELALAPPAVVAQAAGLPILAQTLELAAGMERELWGER